MLKQRINRTISRTFNSTYRLTSSLPSLPSFQRYVHQITPTHPPPFFSSAGSVTPNHININGDHSINTTSSTSSSNTADEAIETMSLEQLVSQLYDGSWSGHDTINALERFTRSRFDIVRDLRSLSEKDWRDLHLQSSIERAIRLYLLSTARVEEYATRMNLPAETEYKEDLLRSPLYRSSDLGKPLPHSPHACSVCLPTWRHVIGYEEGTEEVISAMACGYPRFFIHPYVSRLFEVCARQFAMSEHETCFAFPSLESAMRCATFLQAKIGFGVSARAVPLGQTGVHAVVFRKNLRLPVRLYWQHFGDIISSRYAWDLLHGTVAKPQPGLKHTIKERIASQFTECAPHDVYLYPSGMSAISKGLQMAQVLNPGVRSVQFGFPYLDALKVQTVFGPGAVFYPRGDEADIDDLATRLKHEKFSAVLVEFPGNPLLSLPNLPRLSALLRPHNIPLIVDDTVSSFGNLDILPYADMITSSLTKWFSGAGDVMAGSLILNRNSPFYGDLKAWQNMRYEDLFYEEDARVLERNSRDFNSRLAQVNETTRVVTEFLSKHPAVKTIYSPLNQTAVWGSQTYSADNAPNSLSIKSHPALKTQASPGFGGLFSIVLHHAEETSPIFYDNIEVSKGPSLGNNFTLCCPYTLLAHYTEIDWAESVGIDKHILRFSLGLEDPKELCDRFDRALQSIQPVLERRQKQQQVATS